MSLVPIETPDQLRARLGELDRTAPIAFDLEAAGFHRYSDRICLVQFSSESDTMVVDVLAFDPSDHLRPWLESGESALLIHGGDYDIRLLDRDMGINPKGIFDTQVAATLLGEPAIGLAALLEKYLGIGLSKKYQRADWAKRPLPPEMVDYAASDTRHLHELSELLIDRLRDVGRMSWVEEECILMESLRWTDGPQPDPVTRFKGARDLERREVHRLREAWHWRDRIARRRDRAPFRVLADGPLFAAATGRPTTIGELSALKGMSPRLAERDGAALLKTFDRVDAMDEEELQGYPRRDGGGPGRPTPEVEELADKLKAARNRRAEDLGLDRGVLVSNGVLVEVARRSPRTEEELARVDGLRSWQLEAVGDALLAVLAE